jgi:hypothetical protein
MQPIGTNALALGCFEGDLHEQARETGIEELL